MDFKDVIKQLGDRVAKMKDQIQTEEATKHAFILPFLQSLGYDVFNPLEVVPEFIADLGIKKGEKVDFAIMKDGLPIILIECKHWREELDPHNSQLFRYFHTTKAKFSILTNGINYRFYTDLIEQNKMDEKPFFEFKINEIKEAQVEKLKEFHKSYFNIESMVNTASELKYLNELRNQIIKETSDPSDDFTRLFAKSVYPSVVTAKVLDQFKSLLKRSFSQYFNDLINDRLKSALDNQQKQEKEELAEDPLNQIEDLPIKIVTSEDELEGYRIIRAILRQKVDGSRISHRDTQSYFGVLLDDNNRRPICRLHLNGKKKAVSLFTREKEERKEISTIDDLYNFADHFISIVDFYEKEKAENSKAKNN